MPAARDPSSHLKHWAHFLPATTASALSQHNNRSSRMSKNVETQPRCLTYNTKDVLFGYTVYSLQDGKSKIPCRENGGNVFLLRLIGRACESYNLADMKCDYMDRGQKKSKRDIREAIVAAVVANGGRFLEVKGGFCVRELSFSEAVSKLVYLFKACNKQRIAQIDGEPESQVSKMSEEQSQQISNSSELCAMDIESVVAGLESTSGSCCDNLGDICGVESAFTFTGKVSSYAAFSAGDHQVLSLKPANAVSYESGAFMKVQSWSSMSSIGCLLSDQDSDGWSGQPPLPTVSSQCTDSFVPSLDGWSALTTDPFAAVATPLRSTEPGTSKGNLGDILYQMKKDLNDDKLQVQWCGDLAWAIWNEKNTVLRETSIEADIRETALQSLRIHCQNVKVPLYLFGVFERLCKASRAKLAKPTVVAMVAAMSDLIIHERVQIGAFSTLIKLARDKHFKKLIAEANGIRAVVTAMREHPSNVQVQESGCWVLGNLAHGYQVGRNLIGATGGITAVIEAMNQHSLIAGVQNTACWALGNLSCGSRFNGLLIGANGISAVVMAMRTHKAHAEGVQRIGCWVLGNLAKENKENQCLIIAADGIGAIVSTMKQRAFHESIQRNGCVALGNIASSNEAACLAIDTAEGIDAIVAAISDHPTSEDVHRDGCFALMHIAKASTDARRKIRAAGGLRLVRQAKVRFKSKSLRSHCARILSQFDSSDCCSIQYESATKRPIKSLPIGQNARFPDDGC